MAKKQTGTITTQTTTFIANIITPRGGGTPTKARLYVTGTFNGSTATVRTSADGGVTYVDEKNAGGTSITFTANGYCDLEIPCVTSNQETDKPIILAVTTTVANPTGIVATLFDLT